MAVVLTYGASMPVIKMGRMAGPVRQAALQRHRDPRRRDAAGLPRRHRQRLRLHAGVAQRTTRAGCCRATTPPRRTLNLIRAFTQGGFADLRAGAQLEPGLHRATRPTPATSRWPGRSTAPSSSWPPAAPTSRRSSASSSTPATRRCCWTTSAPLTRIDSRTGTPVRHLGALPVDRGAHPRAGRRPRRLPLPGAQPDRRQARPDHDAATTCCELIDKLDPNREPGRLTFITRMGAEQGPRRAAAAARGDQGVRMPRRCGSPIRCTATGSPRRPATRPGASTTSWTRCKGFFEAHRAVGTVPGRHPRRADRRRRHRVPRRLGADRRGDARDPLRVGLRPAPEPHAVARAGVPGRRGARRAR